MIDHYTITATGIKPSSAEQANWIVLKDADHNEVDQMIQKYDLPADLFVGRDQPEEVSRFEKLKGTALSHCYSLVLINLNAETDAEIEDRLQPVSFIVSDEVVITYTSADFIDTLIERQQSEITSPERLITYSLLSIYSHFIKQLLELKKRIDKLDQAARKTTENKELFNLADTERDMVYLDHTLDDQGETVDALLKDENFNKRLADDALLYDIRLRQHHANKLVVVYRDLLETIGGLFTDMMDNNLNHLMKYLDSAALVISIPALITGIWGMNAGGMPWENSKLGFLVVMIIATLLGVLSAVYLSKKDYSK